MSARFNYTKPTKREVHDFTDRQKDIIGGLIDDVPLKQELTAIIKKADSLGIQGVTESLYSLYEDILVYDKTYIPKYTEAEAEKRIQELTPFPIDWGHPKKYKPR